MLRQKLKQADILVLKAATMAEKRQEALQEQSRLEPRVDLLAGCTRELQKLVLDYFHFYLCSQGFFWCFPSGEATENQIFAQKYKCDTQ